MSFLSTFFGTGKKAGESVVLIDIGAGSIAGAYAYFTAGEQPTLLYSRRLPIEFRQNEAPGRAMLRALLIVGNELIRDGAPVLSRTTGSGSADAIFVSVGAPWQETSVHTEHFERDTPFVLTKKMVAAALAKTSVVPPQKSLVDDSVIGTVVNGYETRDPYEKSVRSASVIVLTSLIDTDISDGITATLRGLYHTKSVRLIAGSSLRYQAMRTVFPHERDMLILDATGPLTSIALVRKNLFVALAEVANPTDDSHAWAEKVAGRLAELMKQYPLPRTIFLLARELDSSVLTRALVTADLKKFWLSNNPPKVVPVLASHVNRQVRHASPTPPDLLLSLMALFYRQHAHEGEM